MVHQTVFPRERVGSGDETKRLSPKKGVSDKNSHTVALFPGEGPGDKANYSGVVRCLASLVFVFPYEMSLGYKVPPSVYFIVSHCDMN